MGDALLGVVLAIGIVAIAFWCGFLVGIDDANLGHTFSKDDLIKAKVAYYDKHTGELKLIKKVDTNGEK